MASEIRVDKINSLSGVGTVTLSPTGVDIAGITTAATLRATTGIVTSLTAGSLTSLGAVSGTTGTFSGAVSGTTGTFSSAVSGTTGTFSGAVSGTTGTFSGAVSGTTGTFSSAVSGTTGTFSGAVSGTTGTFTGNVAVSGANITLQDSGSTSDDRLVFGAGSDLSIYHNGSNSYIDDSGTGNLFIRSNEVRINKYTNEYMIRAIADGAVELYHDNSKKVETNSTGINMVDKVITFQGQSNRRIAYRDGESDILFEFDSGDFMRQDIGNSRHEFFVGNTKRVSVTSDGLTFGSDTAAANALDDYEEGTWTPSVASGAGTVTLGTGGAKYTKIGRVVYCQFDINLSNASSNTGNSGFSLPFNSASVYGSGSVGWTNRGYPLFVHVQATAFAIMDNSSSAGGSSQHSTYAELNGTRFIGDFRYFIA